MFTLAILLALVGVALLALEFFLPGIIVGVIGGIFIFGSMALFFSAGPSLALSLLYLFLLAASIFGAVRFALWKIRSSKSNTIFLSEDQEGFQAAFFPKELIGKTGKAYTDLKPSGHILIDGQKFQALSQKAYIEKESPVKVIEGRGGHLIVNIIKEETQ